MNNKKKNISNRKKPNTDCLGTQNNNNNNIRRENKYLHLWKDKWTYKQFTGH